MKLGMQYPILHIVINRLLPLLIIVAAFFVFFALKASKPKPDQKQQTESYPLVEVMQVSPETVQFEISSYGVTQPKYQTQLVSQVSGKIMRVSDKFAVGAMIKKNKVLAQIEPSDYKTELAQARANLAKAQAQYQREKAESEVAARDWQQVTNQKPTDLGLRKPQLKQEKANVDYAKAALERAKRNLDRTAIRAPFDGLIRVRNIDLGQYITSGKMVGELYDTRMTEIRLPISAQDIAFLPDYQNETVGVTLTAKLAGQPVIWEGIITRDEGIIDETNRMLYLIAEVKDPYIRLNQTEHQHPLKFGSFVSAQIQGMQLSGVFKIPRYLVRDDQVMLVNNKKISYQKVTVIRSDKKFAYISAGLKAGDLISLTQLENVQEGAAIQFLNTPKSPASSQQDSSSQLNLKLISEESDTSDVLK
tara:strand:- start:3173 stop:4429 length:1257 start_codon:yes stop_codon:yes gene_type:complete